MDPIQAVLEEQSEQGPSVCHSIYSIKGIAVCSNICLNLSLFLSMACSMTSFCHKILKVILKSGIVLFSFFKASGFLAAD